jgi:hypothetical protein
LIFPPTHGGKARLGPSSPGSLLGSQGCGHPDLSLVNEAAEAFGEADSSTNYNCEDSEETLKTNLMGSTTPSEAELFDTCSDDARPEVATGAKNAAFTQTLCCLNIDHGDEAKDPHDCDGDDDVHGNGDERNLASGSVSAADSGHIYDKEASCLRGSGLGRTACAAARPKAKAWENQGTQTEVTLMNTMIIEGETALLQFFCNYFAIRLRHSRSPTTTKQMVGDQYWKGDETEYKVFGKFHR